MKNFKYYVSIGKRSMFLWSSCNILLLLIMVLSKLITITISTSLISLPYWMNLHSRCELCKNSCGKLSLINEVFAYQYFRLSPRDFLALLKSYSRKYLLFSEISIGPFSAHLMLATIENDLSDPFAMLILVEIAAI